MLKVALALSLITGPAFALEATVESSAESAALAASESTAGSSASTISPALSSTLAAAVVIASVLYGWDRFATKRAYNRAADEARASLSANDAQPITHSAADSALRRAADVERERLRLAGRNPADLDEVALAKVIIAHADGMTARP